MGQAVSNFNQVLGNQPSFDKTGTIKLQRWQCSSDREGRVEMINTLIILLRIKLGNSISKKKLTDISRLVELALYRRANSYREYLNWESLEKRLEYLALIGSPPLAQASSRKRKPSRAAITPPKRQKASRSDFILGNQTDMISHVLSFLDGSTILKISSVNRFTRDEFPQQVRQLTLTSDQISLGRNIITKCSNLQSLVITNHQLNDTMMVQATETKQCYCCTEVDHQIPEMLRCFPKLKQLSMHSVFFNSMPLLEGLLDALAYCNQLTHLSLTAIGLGDTGAVKVAEALCSLGLELQHLDLRKNYIGEKGMTALGRGLISCTKLQRLMLGGNLVTTEGLVPLLKAMSSLELTSLSLDSNFIDSRGVEKLCETLITREVAVKEVYLGKNFDVQEAEASLEMLQQAKQLQFLDIGEIDADTAESLSYLLQNNPALHYQIKNI